MRNVQRFHGKCSIPEETIAIFLPELDWTKQEMFWLICEIAGVMIGDVEYSSHRGRLFAFNFEI